MDPPRHPRPGVRPPLSGPLRRRALGRWLRDLLRPPRTLRPTRAGWLFFALTLGVGFAALNTGNNLLYLVLSFMLAFLVLSGVLSESALRGISVRRRLPREVFAGGAAPVALEIRNAHARTAAFGLVVEDLAASGSGDFGSSTGSVFALRVGPGATETRTYPFSPPERGLFGFAGFRVSTRFPFGLFSKAMLLPRGDQALVYPTLDLRPLEARLRSHCADADRAPAHGRSGSEAAGLREFAPGDPWRRVHWRASLRRGALVVRELEREGTEQVEVRLQTRQAADRSFERAVSRAASQVVALLERGLRVALRTERVRFPADAGPGQRARLLAFLARVAAEPTGDAP